MKKTLSIVAASAIVLMVGSVRAAHAATLSACISGSVDTIVGTTCTIGDKSFDFLSFDTTGSISASQLQFLVDASDPLAPSFTLAGTITATGSATNSNYIN